MLGYTEEELQGIGVANIHPKDALQHVISEFEAQARGEKLVAPTIPCLRKDGTTFYADICTAKLQIDGRECNAGFFTDVTERKQAEEALKREKEKAEKYLDIAGVMLATVDTDENITLINKKGCEILGYNEEELIGKNWFDLLVPQEKRGEIRDVFGKLTAGDIEPVEYYENTLLTKNGEQRLIAFHNTVVRDTSDQIVGVLLSGDDITDRKQADGMLLESEERYHRITEAVTDYIYTVRIENGQPAGTDHNQTSEAVTGYSPEEFNRDPHLWIQMVPEEDRDTVRNQLSRILSGDDTEPIEHRIARKDGCVRWVLSTLVANRDGRGNLLSYDGLIRDITDRKQAEEALRIKESAIKSSLNAIAITDLEGKLTYVNPSFLGLWGYDTEQEIIGKVAVESWQMEEKAREVMQSLQEKGGWFGELTAKREDGSLFDVQLSANMVTDETGSPVCMMASFVDITEHKRSEETLVRRAEFERLISEVSSGLVGLGMDELDTGIEVALASIASFSRADRVYVFLFRDGNALMDNTHEWCAEGVEPQIGNLKNITVGDELPWFSERIRNGEVVHVPDVSALPPEARLERKHFEDQAIQSLIVVPIASGGRLLGFLGFDAVRGRRVWTDDDQAVLRIIGENFAHLIERKRAEEALRKSEGSYQELFTSLLEGVGVVDEYEKIVYCNPAYARIFEEDGPESMIGTNLLQYVTPNQKEIIQQQTAHRKMRQSSQYELGIVTANNNRKILHVSVSPRFNESGVYIGAFGNVVDITETKRLQELESRAQRLETAGTIAGQVAHDFNNLLAPLMAYPELIRDELPKDHPALAYLGAIETATAQIADINQQLLTLGRRGHYNQEPLNLNEIVLQASKGIEPLPDTMACEVNLSKDLMNILGGGAQINRVISNLLDNARDAMQDVGYISVKTENYYVDEVSIAYGRIPKGEYAKLTISDTGCGIPDDIVQRIFDPFFTSKTTDKKRGSGLGLSVVDAVVRDHGGYIDLSSKVGGGTSFYLYFPVTRKTVAGQDYDKIPGGTETVLVVDDDSLQRDVSLRLLEKLGYRVSTAESGEKAIELLKEKPQDLLVLDMIMPPGIDGAETYRRAIEINPDQKAIITSGFSETKRVLEAQSLGAGTFLKKPLTASAIAAAVRKELDRKVKVTV